MYIQTFPEEHVDFVHKYGQRIDIPEPSTNLYEGGWSYYDSQLASAQPEQPSGFYYHHPTYQPASAELMAASIASRESDVDATSMLQYIASPPSVAAQTHHQYVNNTTVSTAPYDDAPASPNVSAMCIFCC